MLRVEVGDYVIAHRWWDMDWNDPWAIGFVVEIRDGRVRVGERDGGDIAGVGGRWFPHATRVSAEWAAGWFALNGG